VSEAARPGLVVDNSVSLSWCLGDESDAYAAGVLQALATNAARVPCLWPYEVANGLWMSERRGRITAAEISRALADLAALPIIVDAVGHTRALTEVLALSRREGLTAYDAAYLELAMREGLPLATLDQQLREAAARLGVPEFQP
jgi:predicted nucleic acid-binding protein